jgi:hypothetical protein
MLVLASAEGVAGTTASATVVAALIIAGITARTTNRRQREALNHDRELADLADLRKLLDDAAIAIDAARSARQDAEVRVRMIGMDSPPSLREKLAREAQKVIHDGEGPLRTLTAGLRVRLGSGDPITLVGGG